MKIKSAVLILLAVCFALPVYAQTNKQELSALLGGMVQSDKWIIRKDKAEEEFTGNVKYENDIYKITADKVLSQRALFTYTLSGNVFARRSQDGSTLTLTANKVVFNQKQDYGYAQGTQKKQVHLKLYNEADIFNLYADKLNFGGKFTGFEAQGDCEINDLDNTLYAGKMTFDTQTQVFTAQESRPLFFGYNADGDYALQADTITADNKNGIYTAQGRVQGWIVPAEDISKYTQGNKDGAKIF